MSDFKIDMHVHTSTVSRCAKVEPKEVVRLYTEAGFDGIVVTDHYYEEYFDSLGEMSWKQKMDCYFSGYREAKEAAGNELKVFWGIEFKNVECDNDFLVYGLTEEFLYQNPELYKLSLKEALEKFREVGTMIIQAHPVRIRMVKTDEETGVISRNYRVREMMKELRLHPDKPQMTWSEGMKLIAEDNKEAFREPVFLKLCNLSYPELLNGIEAYNGNINWAQDPREVRQIQERYPSLVSIAAADFHEVIHCGRGGIIAQGEIETIYDVMDAVKNNRITLFTTED